MLKLKMSIGKYVLSFAEENKAGKIIDVDMKKMKKFQPYYFVLPYSNNFNEYGSCIFQDFALTKNWSKYMKTIL
jgi:hypothetical protein